jgi:hypothetical protein
MPHTYQAEIKAVISGLRDLSAVAKSNSQASQRSEID